MRTLRPHFLFLLAVAICFWGFFPAIAPAQTKTKGPDKAADAAEARAADVLRPKGLGLLPEDDLLLARQRAITLAGAFANDGYRLRDGSWSLSLSENQPAILALWLFARNGVWLAAATTEKGSSPQIDVFAPNGTALATMQHAASGTTAVGFFAPTTGLYYIRARWSGPSTPFCLVYSYK